MLKFFIILKMDTERKTYIIKPCIMVKDSNKKYHYINLKDITLDIQDYQWGDKEFYENVENMFKSLILPNEIPFKNMTSFHNIKHHSLQYSYRLENCQVKHYTSTSLMYFFSFDLIDLPNPNKPVEMNFFYEIEDCERQLWSSYLLDLKMSNVSLN